jgi:starvation-inducible DNA-binding protein
MAASTGAAYPVEGKGAIHTMSNFTVPGLSEGDAKQVIDILQERLTAYNDLHLILKHAHWNVVGPTFIGVHEMLDPEVERVRGDADDVAERIAALGGEPVGTPDSHAPGRDPLQYPINKGTVQQHLLALNEVYDKVITDTREADSAVDQLDPVTEDLIVGQVREMEKFQWFIRAHLEDGNGDISGGA